MCTVACGKTGGNGGGGGSWWQGTSPFTCGTTAVLLEDRPDPPQKAIKGKAPRGRFSRPTCTLMTPLVRETLLQELDTHGTAFPERIIYSDFHHHSERNHLSPLNVCSADVDAGSSKSKAVSKKRKEPEPANQSSIAEKVCEHRRARLTVSGAEHMCCCLPDDLPSLVYRPDPCHPCPL